MATVQVNETDVRSPGEIKRQRNVLVFGLPIILVAVVMGMMLIKVDRYIEAHGYVASLRHAELRAAYGGAVQVVDVQHGQSVKAGERIARMDGTIVEAELASAQALLAREQAALAAYDVRMERGNAAERPAADGPAATELPVRVAGVDATAYADPERAALVTAVAYAEQQVALAEARVAALELRAPSDGVVLLYHLSAGSDVAADQLVAEVYDPATLVMHLRVRERQADLVKASQPCTISLAAAVDAAPFSATLTDCGEVIRPTGDGGYRDVSVRLPATELPAARVGGEVSARILVGRISVLSLLFNP